MKEALNFDEAGRLCNKYQFLIGSRVNNGKIVVESVAIVPADAASKYRFFLYYLLYDNNAELALKQGCSTTEYDVMVIGKSDAGEMFHQSLDSWLSSGSTFCNNQTGFTPQTYADSLYV